MGVWGTGIFANDTAADLKGLFEDVVRLPIRTDRLIEIIASSFSEAASEADESHSDFYLALADLCHTYGIDAPSVREKALDLIANGHDLDKKRELGMSKRDLRRPAAVLEAFAQKIVTPNPKPRNRRALSEPEPWLFEEGSYARFPTREKSAINPYMNKSGMSTWAQDGWGGFVVLARSRHLDYFAIYFIAILPSLGAAPPKLTEITSAPTRGIVRRIILSPQHFRRMRIKKIECLQVIEGAVEAAFPPEHPIFRWQPEILVNVLYPPISGRVTYQDGWTWCDFESEFDLRKFVVHSTKSIEHRRKTASPGSAGATSRPDGRD